jgi:hypothetical protein
MARFWWCSDLSAMFLSYHSRAITSKLFAALSALDCLIAFLFSLGSIPPSICFLAVSRFCISLNGRGSIESCSVCLDIKGFVDLVF